MKKLLAIILATVMVAAMLPASIVSAADAMDTYNYVFGSNAHKATQNAGTNGIQVDSLLIEDTDTSVSSGRWGVEELVDANGDGSNDRHGYYYSGGNYYGGGFQSRYNGSNGTARMYYECSHVADGNGTGTWLSGMEVPTIDMRSAWGSSYPAAMLEIEVPEDGTFIPSFDVMTNAKANGVIAEYYLVKKTAANKGSSINGILNSATANDRIAVLDYFATTGIDTFAPVTLDKGIYYFVMMVNGRSAAAKVATPTFPSFQVNVKKFTLQEIPGAELVGTSTKFDLSTAAYTAEALAGRTEVELLKSPNLATDVSNEIVATFESIDTTKSGKWAYKYGYGAWLQATENGDASDTPAKVTADGFTIGRSNFIYRIRSNGIYKTGGTAAAPYFTLQIDVPVEGTYDLEIANSAMAAPSLFYNAYVFPEDTTQTNQGNFYTKYIRKTGLVDGKRPQITTHFVGSRDLANAGSGKIGSFTAAKAGTYYIVFEFDGDMSVLTSNSSDNWTNAQSITFNSIDLKLTSLPAIDLPPAAIAKEQQQNVDPENAEKEAVGSSIANVTVFAMDIDGNAIDYNNGIVQEITGMEVGTTTMLTAPEIPGYRFDYWARDIGKNSRPVSTNPQYVFKATKGGSKFYAVYSVKGKSETCWVEFYDANRELVERTKYTAGETVIVPALPTSSARGQALKWASAVSDYEFDYEGGATFTAPNRAILAFVAQYSDDDASLKNVKVTVAGTTGATVADSYKFGETVTVVAPDRENSSGTKVFAYWIKGDEIVSFEKSYSFVATKDVTVTAVYQDYLPVAKTIRKILVDSVGTGTNTEVFAEFIGCEDAIERGFIFGDANVTLDSAIAKASMKTNAKSFSMINDIEGATAKAYAIFADGVIYSK